MATRTVASVGTREYDELLRLLRETREAAGVSQESLSKTLGRARTFIGKIEAGTRRVDVVEFYQVAQALGLNPLTLFGSLAKRLDLINRK